MSRVIANALILCAGLLLLAHVNPGNAQGAATPELDEATLLGLGYEAFLYGLPPAELTKLRASKVLTASDEHNTFTHQRVIFPPGTGTCCPNRDTLYSVAWLDVSEEPVLLTIPPTGGRYFGVQVVDIHTRNKHTLSRRTVGSKGGLFLFTGIGWKGKVPAGVRRLDLGANDGMALVRIEPRGKDEVAAVNALQDKFTLAHPSGRAKSRTPYVNYDPKDAFGILKVLDDTVRRNPIPGKDAGVAATLAALGIGGSTPFDPARLSARERDTLLKAKDAVLALVTRHLANVGDLKDGWLFLTPGDTFEDDALARAAVALSYILPNDAAEAVYMVAHTDSNGRQLNSAHRYRLEFDGPVPANSFWSLIAYDWPGVRLQKNDHDRYSVDDRKPGLKLNASGGPVIELSADPVGDPATVGWLPLPKGDVSLVIRIYEPKQPVLDGTWKRPRIVRLD